MIGAVAAQIAKGYVAGQHKQQPKQMGEERPLRLLGLVSTQQSTLEQSHRFPLFSVVVAHTTLEDEDLCGYLSAKTVRSIEQRGNKHSYEDHTISIIKVENILTCPQTKSTIKR